METIESARRSSSGSKNGSMRKKKVKTVRDNSASMLSNYYKKSIVSRQSGSMTPTLGMQ